MRITNTRKIIKIQRKKILSLLLELFFTKKAFEISEKFRFEQEYKEIIKKLQEQLDQLETTKGQELKQIKNFY